MATETEVYLYASNRKIQLKPIAAPDRNRRASSPPMPFSRTGLRRAPCQASRLTSAISARNSATSALVSGMLRTNTLIVPYSAIASVIFNLSLMGGPPGCKKSDTFNPTGPL